MLTVGVCLGVLIGAVSGTVFLLLFKAAELGADKKVKTILALVAKLLALPTFWFGGPWLTTRFLKPVNEGEILSPYILSLAVTFVALAAYPLFWFTVKLGKQIAAQGTNTHD